MNLHQPLARSRPFASEPEPLPLPRGNLFTRALTARVLSAYTKGALPAQAIAADRWPDDRLLAAFITRAAANPAMTSVAGWAAELARRVVADGITALGPASAGGQILQAGLVLNFDGTNSISAPGFTVGFGNAGWVAEGAPIPVKQLSATPAILNPHKLGAIAVLTREMMEGSNAEALITDALTRAAGRMLDEVLFDANPGDAARPPGLRNGVAAIANSNNADFFQAVVEDIAALINAVAPVGGNGPYILVGSPGRAAMVGLRMEDSATIQVLGSSAVINDLLCIAPAALAAALSPEPEVEVARAATLHMEDTSPQPVGSAAPHRSLFQTDSIGIKVRWPVTWALRDPRAFAWMTPTWK